MELTNRFRWQFGIKPNYLATLVLAGKKTATCSAKITYSDQDPFPQVGEIHTVLDGDNLPMVDIHLTQVDFEQWQHISSDFALAEGEGSFADWQQAHLDFFENQLSLTVSADFELVCERFERCKIYPKTYQQWLHFAEQTLQETGSNDPFLNPKTDANVLLQAVTKRTKSAIFAFAETLLSETELTELAEKLARRAAGEPIAYILGEKEFWSLPLKVSPATLIPRPDTECLVEQALIEANKRSVSGKKLQILDLGTGTGAIALALAHELGESAEVVGVDKIPQAVQLAESNRQRLGLHNVTFLQSDWFSALQGRQFDIIVANPPYIDEQDDNLIRGDVRFEPKSALIAADNGLADLQKIIENAPLALAPNGILLLEHGWQQAIQVQQLFQQYHWQQIETAQDYGGNDRVTQAIWTN